jgi:hypothetical protein
MHRWFVEYNPLYLLSAMLVLIGLTLLSRAAADHGTMQQELGYVPVIAEVYALSLIAGAALLTRIGQRRPAVMLGLLTVLYQGDLTLLTERHVYLGLTGDLAVAGWLVLFVVKLHALAWALRLKVGRSFLGVAVAGAAGLALLPHYVCQGGATAKEEVVAGWLFALFAAGLWSRRAVVSEVPLDDWQRTVLARSLRATWMLWGTLVLLHVSFWSSEHHVRLGLLVPGAVLLATRWMKREASVWATVTATLVMVATTAPGSLWIVALMGAAVLALRALVATTTMKRAVDATPRTDPYRQPSGADSAPPEIEIDTVADTAARVRLLGGAMFGVWLAAWTHGWTGGSLPAHVLPLDLALTAAALLLVWKARARAILAPLSVALLHFAVQARLVSAPSSSLQWGVTTIVIGFALLIGSLLAGWLLRRLPEQEAEPAGESREPPAGGGEEEDVESPTALSSA